MPYHSLAGIQELGQFFVLKYFRGEWRWDLQPCWDSNGRRVVFDLRREGRCTRYVIDLEPDR